MRFDEKLTFLNLATLVAAIPLTIVFRVVEGDWPRKRLPPVDAMEALGVGAAPPMVQRYLDVFTGILAVVQGLLNTAGDTEPDPGPHSGAPSVIGGVAAGVGLMIQAFSFPLVDNLPGGVTQADWVVYGVYTADALLGACALASSTEPHVASGLGSFLGFISVMVAITTFVEGGKRDAATDVGFASNLASAVPGILNPLKFFQALDIGPIIVGAVDIVGGLVVDGLVVGGLDIAAAELSSEPI